MAKRLDGKRVLITGASRGIGAAIAVAAAAEGARVLLAARKLPGLDAVAEHIRANGGEAEVFPCHVGQLDAVEALVNEAERRFGGLDGLVNNAATNPYFGPALGTPWAAFDKTFEVNVKGPFALSLQVGGRWADAGQKGSIVNVSSILGLRAAPFQATYGMTKAALVSMTRTLAMELGSAGIRVNCVTPGLIDTRFAAAMTESPEILRQYTDRTAMGRVGQPEEVAGIVVHLLSDESAYTTGQIFAVDGGYLAS
ncbi:MAG: hypothetical protein RIT28_1411 [Pseudomonadota bacterium]|jgi:NAD(P)-dependent dehydrogenase (short-subunit alcohol dehydrogenase family)